MQSLELYLHEPKSCCFYRFPEENENIKLFKTYSKNACEFECALEKSEKYCRCKPWNYPRSDEEYNNTILCDMFGNYCFHEIKIRQIGSNHLDISAVSKL
jgi:hypothetical protein